MATVKKVVIIVVMVVAIIGMAACAAGIIGGWVINAPLTQDAVALLAGLSKGLQAADAALSEASDSLGVARGLVAQVQGITGAAGDSLDQTGTAELADLAQGKLSDAVATLERARQTIIGTVETINGLVATLNRLPGVRIEPLDSALVDRLAGLIGDAVQALDQVVGAIETARPGVVEALTRLREAVLVLDNRLKGLETALAQIQPQVRQTLGSVNSLILRVPAIVDAVSIVLTVLLLWLGFAQFGLFMWMRSIYRGTHPIRSSRWRTLAGR
jgi:hypothetical protein